MLHDAFICHASEDKEDLVRPLAGRLREQHIEIWYDEFSLTVGDSLRRSIDRGLSQSRFGIVVLSPSFFAKHWSQWELDGLVARQNSSAESVILPVWHRVQGKDVLAYSPPLADKLAVSTDLGLDEVVRQLVAAIRPQGSTLVIARDHLIERGCNPPVISDDWWLDVAAAAESNDMEGGFQEAMGWGRWGFPLPPASKDSSERGWRLACAAMQMGWRHEAEQQRITQVTRPEVVHSFISSQPGLSPTCHQYVRYLISYAPQLTICGFGGPFEDEIDRLYRRSVQMAERQRASGDRHGTALTTDARPPGCDDEYVLRDPEFGRYRAAHVACGFVQGNYVANGPPVMYYCYIDYLAWLLSEESLWLPTEIRELLTRGMAEWGVWPWHEHDARATDDFGYVNADFTGKLSDTLLEADTLSAFELSADARRDLVHRLSFSAHLLKLSEDGETLAEHFLSQGVIDAYFWSRDNRRTSKRSS